MKNDTNGNPGDDPWAVSWWYYDPSLGPAEQARLDIVTAARLLHTMQHDGIDHAIDLVTVGFHLVGQEVPDDVYHRIQVTLIQLKKNWAPADNAEDMMLLRTYELLKAKRMTRDGAAMVAGAVLGRPVSSEAWRKAVDRWAEKKGLPKVEQRKRRDATDK